MENKESGNKEAGDRKEWPTDKISFEAYCADKIESIQVAIRRKANGSTVEEAYFLEHMEKLEHYFLTNFVKEGM